MIELTITPPNHPLSGKVEPPGSKSITNRVLLLAGLAKGRSLLTGALKSDDTLFMAQALRAMGVDVTEPDATSFVVESDGVRLVYVASGLITSESDEDLSWRLRSL